MTRTAERQRQGLSKDSEATALKKVTEQRAASLLVETEAEAEAAEVGQGWQRDDLTCEGRERPAAVRREDAALEGPVDRASAMSSRH